MYMETEKYNSACIVKYVLNMNMGLVGVGKHHAGGAVWGLAVDLS